MCNNTVLSLFAVAEVRIAPVCDIISSEVPTIWLVSFLSPPPNINTLFVLPSFLPSSYFSSLGHKQIPQVLLFLLGI